MSQCRGERKGRTDRETEGRRAKRQGEEHKAMKKRNANGRKKERQSQTNWLCAVCPFEC